MSLHSFSISIVFNPKTFCLIRQQDVRATEIDKVDMHLSFRPGDIVKALVVSLCFFFLSLIFDYIFKM